MGKLSNSKTKDLLNKNNDYKLMNKWPKIENKGVFKSVRKYVLN